MNRLHPADKELLLHYLKNGPYSLGSVENIDSETEDLVLGPVELLTRLSGLILVHS